MNWSLNNQKCAPAIQTENNGAFRRISHGQQQSNAGTGDEEGFFEWCESLAKCKNLLI